MKDMHGTGKLRAARARFPYHPGSERWENLVSPGLPLQRPTCTDDRSQSAPSDGAASPTPRSRRCSPQADSISLSRSVREPARPGLIFRETSAVLTPTSRRVLPRRCVPAGSLAVPTGHVGRAARERRRGYFTPARPSTSSSAPMSSAASAFTPRLCAISAASSPLRGGEEECRCRRWPGELFYRIGPRTAGHRIGPHASGACSTGMAANTIGKVHLSRRRRARTRCADLRALEDQT